MTVYIVNQQELHARTEGPEQAPVALLIHGWSSSWYTWTPLMPILSRRFHCIAVDLPGYGRSPAMPQRPTIARYTDLIAGLIQQVSERAVLILGHSMGGQIAMTIALRYPMLLERMVLLNPSVSGRLSTFINMLVTPHIVLERFRWGAQVLSWFEGTPFSYTDRLLRPIAFAERATVSFRDYQRIRADARRPRQGRTRAESFWAMRAGDLRGRMHAITVPALVLWGAEDNTVPLRDAGAVAAEWPQADLRLIPNAGHWPQFEQLEITRRYIAAFLGLPDVRGLENDLAPMHNSLSISEIAQFLAHSDLGHALTLTQRTRLAAQLRTATFPPGMQIAAANTYGEELYLVQEGSVEVWATINANGVLDLEPCRIAHIQAGQVVGEMALLEDSTRSGEMRAGPTGTIVLVLARRRFEALCNDDLELGLRIMQNLARSLSLRLRLQNWQLQSARRHYEQAIQSRH